ncbi:MAG: transposase, partial [Firmicutes bacterium]|nr:transposase [Bacillota bacterium]
MKRLGRPEDLLMCHEAGPIGYGYKSHIMTDGNFVISVVVTPANRADAEPFPNVMDQCKE